MKKGKIDLRTCQKGDILISTHNKIFKYIGPTKEGDYYDHIIEYLNTKSGYGTRTHDGYVFRENRIPEADDDIVKIIRIRKLKLEKINKYGFKRNTKTN